jgi:hypothetical protein
MLLLAWTAAHLCGQGVCLHDREPIVPWSSHAPGTPVSIGAGATGGETAGVDGPDDCFCCCRCVEAEARFELPAACAFVTIAPADCAQVPIPALLPVDHPPSA